MQVTVRPWIRSTQSAITSELTDLVMTSSYLIVGSCETFDLSMLNAVDLITAVWVLIGARTLFALICCICNWSAAGWNWWKFVSVDVMYLYIHDYRVSIWNGVITLFLLWLFLPAYVGAFWNSNKEYKYGYSLILFSFIFVNLTQRIYWLLKYLHFMIFIITKRSSSILKISFSMSMECT